MNASKRGTSRVRRRLLPVALLLSALPAIACATDAAGRVTVFASDDADGTSVLRTGVGALFGYEDTGHYRGFVLEEVRIDPAGGDRWTDQRAYYAFAGGGDWRWKGQVGTDGGTVLGSASVVRAGTIRQEYFVERDVLETPLGVQGLYASFLGAAYDLPLGTTDRQQATLLAGVQDFGGENLRTHLRARYIGVVDPDRGLSLQVRTRAFRNSVPFEADYYSPRWFAEVLPMVQLRRFHHRWMYAAALGWGVQRDSESEWRQARLVDATVTSPETAALGYLRLNASYSNTPTATGGSYGYGQLTMEWIKPF